MKFKPAYLRRHGFTLVELLVVIAIIGMLMSLLMPAINAARENARQLQCKNSLRQMAYGVSTHESTYGIFPSGGWGWGWVGDANQSAGLLQPGGWLYAILPYIELGNLFNLGLNSTGSKSDSDMKNERATALKTPTPLFYCPTRREPRTYRAGTGPPTMGISIGASQMVGKCDYAANGGHGWGIAGFGNGSQFGGYSEQQWKTSGDTTFIQEYLGCPTNSAKISSGVIQRRYPLAANAIRDGLGQTYMLGEKYLDASQYEKAPGNDDQGWSIGFDQDNVRFTNHNTPSNAKPFRDTYGYSSPQFAFGSAHASFFHVAMCDSNVRAINYTISPSVHSRLGTRDDGDPVKINEL